MNPRADLAHIRTDLAAGRTTCEQLVQDYLARIEATKELNAYLEVYADEALAQAHAVDAKLAAGTAGKLAGMVVGVKDNIVQKAHRVNAGSRILGEFKSLFTATALERVIAEDAIIIGRQNCDEFAMGSSTENSAFGPVRNPLDPQRVPGGSSGGSAAAVGGNLSTASLGSDTGGSIRQPAAFCGSVGLKPTYGRISRYGLIAYASSFDQIGTITHSVADAALLLEVMAGQDPHDATSAPNPVEAYSQLLASDKPARIAVLREAFDSPGLDPEIRTGLEALLAKLSQAGHVVEEVSLPMLDYLVPVYYVLTTAEASSNLARFDGVRYGYRSPGVQSPEEIFRRTRSEGFGPEVQRRIMLGTFVLSTGYFDAYYGKAQKVRRLIRDTTLAQLADFDVIVTPTAPSVAFKFGEKSDDPIQMYLSDIYTVQANLAGCPAISLPVRGHSSGMPYGIQLMAAPFAETRLLQIAASIEQLLH